MSSKSGSHRKPRQQGATPSSGTQGKSIPYLSLRAEEAWVAFLEKIARRKGLKKSSFARNAITDRMQEVVEESKDPTLIEEFRELMQTLSGD